EKAAEWGLIWDCVDDERLQADAMALAQQLSQLPAHAIVEARALFAASEGNDLTQQLELERTRQQALIDGESFGEGLHAFFERLADDRSTLELVEQREEAANHGRLEREGRRQLHQQHGEPVAEAGRFLEEALQRLACAAQVAFVRDRAGQLHREAEAGRRLLGP